MTSHEAALEAALNAAAVPEDERTDVVRDSFRKIIEAAFASTLSPDVSGLVERLREMRENWALGSKGPIILTEAVDALASLSLRLAAVEGERDDFQRLFDQQWKRTREAGELWRKAHPGNDLVSPDLGELVKWLVERAETAEASLIAAQEENERLRKALKALSASIFAPNDKRSPELEAAIQMTIDVLSTQEADHDNG